MAHINSKAVQFPGACKHGQQQSRKSSNYSNNSGRDG